MQSSRVWNLYERNLLQMHVQSTLSFSGLSGGEDFLESKQLYEDKQIPI